MEDLVSPYTSFAAAYDTMMANVDYVRWANYVQKLFAHYNVRPRRILDMACGTGSTTILLAEKGYEMSGTDRAMEMLISARSKANEKGLPIHLWQQDMRDLAVTKPYDAVLCLYDSINYITTEKEMKQVFTRVSEALVSQGMFIFDVTTEYNIVKHFDKQTFAESTEDYSYIWRNLYFHKEKLCKTVLTFFLREGTDFCRYEELHIQKIYTVAEIKRFLEQTGYKLLSSFDAFTFNRWGKLSERINFTAVKEN